MRLVTFVHNGQARLGALHPRDAQKVVDLNGLDGRLPSDILVFLAAGEHARSLAAQALQTSDPSTALDLSAVTLLAPVPRPGKIMCVGLNYRDHAEESHMEVPEYPTIFTKYANCVTGPGADIVLPKVSDQIDYEGELAVVIGKRGRHISEADAPQYVAGYVPFNDVSARDYQMRTTQWTIGKTFDTFGPMGPALVTSDEVPDPHNLDLKVSIGGEVLQSSNTRHLIFNCYNLIAYLSSVMTLEPGDLISTGTPSGVGAARNPKRFLKPGEVVRVEISGLGVLENPVVPEV
ncbi:MAG: fumarylacetoacetate hydrolase family protein [Anaerolineae bacterium]